MKIKEKKKNAAQVIYQRDHHKSYNSTQQLPALSRSAAKEVAITQA